MSTMSFIEKRGDRAARTMRWIARIVSSIAIAFGLFMLISHAVFDEPQFNETEAEAQEREEDAEEDMPGLIVFVIFFLITSAALVFAWGRERIGGTVAFFGSVVMALAIFFTAGSNRLMAASLITLPFWSSGILFVLSSVRTCRLEFETEVEKE